MPPLATLYVAVIELPKARLMGVVVVLLPTAAQLPAENPTPNDAGAAPENWTTALPPS